MKLLEYLDRVGERRSRQRPRDIRQFIGFAFLLGYYVMVWHFANSAIPADNAQLIKDAMLQLGPPVGLIVGAMFRSDVRDEAVTDNTGKAFRAIEAAARARGGEDPQPVVVTNPPSDPVPTTSGDEELPDYAR